MIGYHWVSKSSKGCLQPEGRFSCTQRQTSLKSSCPKLQGTKLTVHPMLIVSPGMIPHTSLVVEHLAIERLEVEREFMQSDRAIWLSWIQDDLQTSPSNSCKPPNPLMKFPSCHSAWCKRPCSAHQQSDATWPVTASHGVFETASEVWMFSRHWFKCQAHPIDMHSMQLFLNTFWVQYDSRCLRPQISRIGNDVLQKVRQPPIFRKKHRWLLAPYHTSYMQPLSAHGHSPVPYKPKPHNSSSQEPPKLPQLNRIQAH